MFSHYIFYELMSVQSLPHTRCSCRSGPVPPALKYMYAVVFYVLLMSFDAGGNMLYIFVKKSIKDLKMTQVCV